MPGSRVVLAQGCQKSPCRPPRKSSRPLESLQKTRYAMSRNPRNGAAILAVPRLNLLCSPGGFRVRDDAVILQRPVLRPAYRCLPQRNDDAQRSRSAGKDAEQRGSPNHQAGAAAGQPQLKVLADAGAPIALGTDTGTNLGQWQGYFEHVELEMMVKAGLTPMQALVAATGGAARVMKLDQQLGTVHPGKWADLLVLNANPLGDIRNTRQIDSVWIAGRRLPNLP